MMKKLTFLVSFMIINCPLIFGDLPPATGLLDFYQPNGFKFKGRIIGDQSDFIYVTEDEYPFLLNLDDYSFYYARKNQDGKYVKSDCYIGITDPLKSDFEKFQPDYFQKSNNIEERYLPEAISPVKTVTGSVSLGVILIQFPDRFGGYQRGNTYQYLGEYLDNKYFSTEVYTERKKHPDNALVFGSFNDYWTEVSYGKLTITGRVLNDHDGNGHYIWLMADNNKSYYNSLPRHSTTLINEAIDKANAEADINPDFADPDDFDYLCILYAGNEGNYGLGLQPFACTFDNYYVYQVSEKWAGGSGISTYQEQDAYFGHIGVDCHEFAHLAFSLPEKYVTNGGGDVGDWGLMGTGLFNQPSEFSSSESRGSCPAHLNAVSKYQAGFLDPTIVSQNQTGVSINSIEDYEQAFLFPINGNSEYFMIENKNYIGFDRKLPGQGEEGTPIGLLIWHVSNNTPKWWNDDLEEADNIDDNSNNAFPGGTENHFFTPLTTPSSAGYIDYGTATGISIKNISLNEITGIITADFYINEWSGNIWMPRDWAGEQRIIGDVKIDINPESGPEKLNAESIELPEAVVNIASGSTIIFNPGTKVIVDGYLSVNGTVGDTVLFTSGTQFPSSRDWEGISFLESAYEDCQIQYAKFEYADTAISINNFSPTISHSSIINSVYGINVTGSNAEPSLSHLNIEHNACATYFSYNAKGSLTYTHIIDNTYGILINTAGPLIQGNVIQDNSYGIRASYSYTQSWTQNHISDNNISDNNYGIYLWNSSPTVHNNQIIYNKYGLRNYQSSSPIVTENDIQYNQYYGFYCGYYSNPLLHYNSSYNSGGYNKISLNGTYGVQASSNSVPILGLPNPNLGGHNSIFSNSSYEIYNTTSGTVYASRNWWGKPSGPSTGDLYGSVYWNPPLSEAPGGGEMMLMTAGTEPIETSDMPIELLMAYNEKCNSDFQESLFRFKKFFLRHPSNPFASFAVEEYISSLISSGLIIEKILKELQEIQKQVKNGNINFELCNAQILLKIRSGDYESALELLDNTLKTETNEDFQNWLLIQKGFLFAYCLNNPDKGISAFEEVISRCDEKDDVYEIAHEEINLLSKECLAKFFKRKGDKVAINKLPTKYCLYDNYPNPFNSQTIIKYEIPDESQVKLIIYDITGRSIKTLVNNKQSAGYYSIQWNANALPSGVYFYQIQAGSFRQVRKCLLVK